MTTALLALCVLATVLWECHAVETGGTFEIAFGMWVAFMCGFNIALWAQKRERALKREAEEG